MSYDKYLAAQRSGLAKADDVADGGLTGMLILLWTVPVGVLKTFDSLCELQLSCSQNAVITQRGGGGGGVYGLFEKRLRGQFYCRRWLCHRYSYLGRSRNGCGNGTTSCLATDRGGRKGVAGGLRRGCVDGRFVASAKHRG